MLSTITREHASTNIEQSIGACQRLLILIEDEREALKDRDTDGLERIIKEKSTNLLTLEVAAKQRFGWLSASAVKDANENAWLAQLAALDRHLEGRWQHLKSLLEECQMHNEINGKILARNQQVFTRLVAIVRGQGDHLPLYSAKGARSNAPGYQTLGEA
jgi:flagella synthesis protein FlgN